MVTDWSLSTYLPTVCVFLYFGSILPLTQTAETNYASFGNKRSSFAVDENSRFSYNHATTASPGDSESSAYRHEKAGVESLIEAPQPQRLDEIYRISNSNRSSAHILLQLRNFAQDFNKWNPRDRSGQSRFKWQTVNIGSNVTALADNAWFKTVKSNGGYDQTADYVQLLSIPFQNEFYNEGFITTKNNFAVDTGRRLLGRMKFSCHTIDVDKNPFNRSEVVDAQSDPRLASSGFQMCNIGGTKPQFYIAATNTAVWAVYNAQTFIAKRKIGVRERYDDIVDAGIELDGLRAVVNYYLNGYKVWTIHALGLPPPDDGETVINYGRVEQAALLNITGVTFSFGNAKCLDESDPNNPNSPSRLVRIVDTSDPFYSSNTNFYASTKNRANINWGQGAKMNLYKLLIAETESRATTVREKYHVRN